MIIDVHSHYRHKIFSQELQKKGLIKAVADSDGKKHLFAGDVCIAPMPDQYAEPNLEKRIEYLDQRGIDMQVLSIPRASDYSAEDSPFLTKIANDGIAEVVRKYPNRLIGLASIPLRNEKKALEELDRAVNELGLKGVCISGNIGGVSLDSDSLWPFYKKVVDFDIPIFVHPGIPLAADQMKNYALIPTVGFEFDLILGQLNLIFGGVLEEFPTIKFIFAHLGGGSPFLKERIENGWEFAKVVPAKKTKIKKSPGYYFELLYFEAVSFYKPALLCTLQCSGADKILFGTDYPLGRLKDPNKPIKNLKEELDLCELDKAKILGENARRLFKIG